MSIKDVIFAIFETAFKLAAAAVIVVMIYRGANLAFDYGYRIFQEPPMSEVGRDVTVTIPEGMSAEEMGELFYQKGLIRDVNLFRLQYLLSEFKDDLNSGKFILSTSMQVEEMMKVMTGDPIEEEDATTVEE